MKFFGRETSIGKVDIDTSGSSADSPEMIKRLDRISVNYEKLESILTELEEKIKNDERLKSKNNEKPSEIADSEATALEPTSDENPDPPTANPKKPR